MKVLDNKLCKVIEGKKLKEITGAVILWNDRQQYRGRFVILQFLDSRVAAKKMLQPLGSTPLLNSPFSLGKKNPLKI